MAPTELEELCKRMRHRYAMLQCSKNERKCWESRLAQRFDQFQTWHNNSQQHTTTCNVLSPKRCRSRFLKSCALSHDFSRFRILKKRFDSSSTLAGLLPSEQHFNFILLQSNSQSKHFLWWVLTMNYRTFPVFMRNNCMILILWLFSSILLWNFFEIWVVNAKIQFLFHDCLHNFVKLALPILVFQRFELNSSESRCLWFHGGIHSQRPNSCRLALRGHVFWENI